MDPFIKDLEKERTDLSNKYLSLTDLELPKTLIGVVPIYLAFVTSSPGVMNHTLRTVTIVCALLSILLAILQLMNSKILYKVMGKEWDKFIGFSKDMQGGNNEDSGLSRRTYHEENKGVEEIGKLRKNSEAFLYVSLINLVVSMVAVLIGKII
ncbi:hypothetical protein KBB12_01560 [Candidatus Woesebacteria bacterium]|nr:hypothetical protein [Candidatus Woesebacteria bacterium]